MDDDDSSKRSVSIHSENRNTIAEIYESFKNIDIEYQIEKVSNELYKIDADQNVMRRIKKTLSKKYKLL